MVTEFHKGNNSLAVMIMNLRIKATGTGQDTAEVLEVINLLNLISIKWDLPCRGSLFAG